MSRVIAIAIILSAFCLSAEAQTVTVTVLNEAGAQIVLKAAAESARQKSAPSAIAVVDPVGDLLAFQRMDGVRPDSVDLAIQKARTAARLRRPTAEIEDTSTRVARHSSRPASRLCAAACRSCWTARSWVPGAWPG